MGGIGCAIWILVFALFGVLLGEKVIAQNGPIATIIGIVIMLGAPAIVVVFVVGLVKRAKDKKE
jgi:membrane protein DedA with SNARE-associated domain